MFKGSLLLELLTNLFLSFISAFTFILEHTLGWAITFFPLIEVGLPSRCVTTSLKLLAILSASKGQSLRIWFGLFALYPLWSRFGPPPLLGSCNSPLAFLLPSESLKLL